MADLCVFRATETVATGRDEGEFRQTHATAPSALHLANAERGLAEIQRVLTSRGLSGYETRLAQLVQHPASSLGRTPRRLAAPCFTAGGSAGSGAARRPRRPHGFANHLSAAQKGAVA